MNVLNLDLKSRQCILFNMLNSIAVVHVVRTSQFCLSWFKPLNVCNCLLMAVRNFKNYYKTTVIWSSFIWSSESNVIFVYVNTGLV